MIIYALAYPDINLVGLMIAGVLPGILIAIAMAAINHTISRGATTAASEALTLADYWRNTWRALPALVLPVLILGGIASGAFTPTEASVVAVFYALVAGRWIYRSLEWRMLPGILSRSALMTASVLVIVAMSAAFAWVLTVSRVPQQLTELIVGMHLSPLAFLFAVNLLLLVFGIFIEPLPGVVVLVPILAPIAHALGINDLQFGIIVIVNLTMGMITPPVGGLLFVTSVVARVPLTRMVGELWPFMWAQLGVLALLPRCPASARCCRGCSGTVSRAQALVALLAPPAKNMATSASRVMPCRITRYAIQCSLSKGPLSLPLPYTIDQSPMTSVAIVARVATITNAVRNVMATSFRVLQDHLLFGAISRS